MSKKKKDPETDANFGIVETKLTRTEVIDLVIQESIDRLNKRNQEIEQEQKDLLDLDISLKHLHPLDGKVRFHPSPGYRNDPDKRPDRFDVSFSVDVSSDDRLQDAFDAWRLLKDERDRNWVALNALQDRARARMAILKQALEKTEDGKQLLEAVRTVSMAVGRRLLDAAAEK